MVLPYLKLVPDRDDAKILHLVEQFFRLVHLGIDPDLPQHDVFSVKLVVALQVQLHKLARWEARELLKVEEVVGERRFFGVALHKLFTVEVLLVTEELGLLLAT